MGKGPDRWTRHRTRTALVQALYQWQFANPATDELEAQFAAAGKLAKVDRELFSTALKVICLLYTSPSPRDATLSRMPSSA